MERKVYVGARDALFSWGSAAAAARSELEYILIVYAVRVWESSAEVG